MSPNSQLYYVYIVTNPNKNVLYTGITNNLARRLVEHWENRGQKETFAGKYYCFNLIYYEEFISVQNAIARENKIKGWDRKKKLDLISTVNPQWLFLNKDF